jgi:4-amino-4-deoxy-L-arabinose transferase-like glycosyltransferase
LYGSGILANQSLTGHEAVVPQSVREMAVHHDWLVPTVGGYPWLERPPLSHWLIAGVAGIVGRADVEWVSRLPAALCALVVVWLTAGMAARWYGRSMGILTGLVLATMWEFFQYATDPEADIFLCLIVTGALACFVRAEFANGTDDRVRFLGGRPWSVLGFFVLLGATNLVKGLLFGTLMVLVPVTSFLALQLNWGALRRYLWLWGWLACAVVWLSWPVLIYQRYPDVWDLWISDYVGRLNRGYVAEPTWYYALALSWVTLPWTIMALLGLWLTARLAWKNPRSPERFLYCWALLTPLVFSIPDGKHHHYLLQCLAPWASLAALGTVRFWQSIPSWPVWLRQPLLGALTLTVPVELALWRYRDRFAGSEWFVPAAMLLWPAVAYGFCWAPTRRNGRLAAGTFFALFIGLLGAVQFGHAHWFDPYRDENAFLQEVRQRVPADQPLYLRLDGPGPLETFRLLFYEPPDTVLLPNLTFLRDQRIDRSEVYLLARLEDRQALSEYGACTVVMESPSDRRVFVPGMRRALFHMRFRDDLTRLPAPRVSPMQATGRAEGPFLK